MALVNNKQSILTCVGQKTMRDLLAVLDTAGLRTSFMSCIRHASELKRLMPSPKAENNGDVLIPKP